VKEKKKSVAAPFFSLSRRRRGDAPRGRRKSEGRGTRSEGSKSDRRERGSRSEEGELWRKFLIRRSQGCEHLLLLYRKPEGGEGFLRRGEEGKDITSFEMGTARRKR